MWMVSLSLLQQMKYVMIVKLEKMNNSISDQMTNTETLQYCWHEMFLSQTAVIFFFPFTFHSTLNLVFSSHESGNLDFMFQ